MTLLDNVITLLPGAMQPRRPKNGFGSSVVRKPYPSTAGVSIPVCGDDNMGPAMPYCVSLNRTIEYDNTSNNTDNCDVRAEITVGSGATSRTIICDWTAGTVINVGGAGQLRVNAITYAPNPNNPYLVANPEALISIGASIGLYGLDHARPRYTERLATLEGGAAALVQVPPWAHAACILGATDTEPGASIYGLANLNLRWVGPNTLPFTAIPATIWNPHQFIPIPSGSSRMQITTDTDVNLAVVWELVL